MSTKEQETFETALVTPASLDTIKAGLSKIDVRQVRTLTAPLHAICMPVASHRVLSCTSLHLRWQAECRNVEDKNQILLELEQGVGSVECNRLGVGLMRKALVAQAKAAQAAAAARQLDNLNGLLDEM